MRIFERFSIFLILCVVLSHCTTKNETNTTDKFVPTNEWQVVKKGQAIPEGLHVRMNFATGVTEAKLLDPEDKSKSVSVVPDTVNNKTKTPEITKKSNKLATLLKEEIEGALKNIPSDSYEPSPNNKFKTLEELKSEFEDLNMEIKTDFEIMQELFNKYEVIHKLFPSSSTLKDHMDQESVDGFISAEMLSIIADMEYLVHQYDNGVEFVKMNGLEKMVYPHLNASDNTLKAEAIKLMGSCLQNNVKVQIHALETNAGDHLLKILALDKSEEVKAKAVYALGALVRRFPLAQKQIISRHGMDVLMRILASENPGYTKLKLKVVSLLEDLVLEHQSILQNHVKGDAIGEEKLRQYYQVDLISKLSDPASCQVLTKLLQECFDLDSSNLYNIDKIFSVINTFSHICKHHHYKDNNLLLLFHKMQTHYNGVLKGRRRIVLDSSEDDSEYIQSILDMIDSYMSELSEAKIKDEL